MSPRYGRYFHYAWLHHCRGLFQMPIAINFDKHLVKVPSRMRLGPASSKVSRDHGSEVFYPAAYRLIGNPDPTFSQQVLDIAKAEGEPGIEPDGLLNDHGWEAISGVADLGHDGHLRPQFIADKPNNVTMPVGVLEPPILRTGRPPRHRPSISWLARSSPLAPRATLSCASGFVPWPRVADLSVEGARQLYGARAVAVRMQWRRRPLIRRRRGAAHLFVVLLLRASVEGWSKQRSAPHPKTAVRLPLEQASVAPHQ